MGFTQVFVQYGKHILKMMDRTPGPTLNVKRSKVVDYCGTAQDQIKALGVHEDTGEGFVMRTAEELEPVRMGFNKFVVIKETK